MSLPASLTQVNAITVDDQGGLWVGGRQGVFVSTDGGTTLGAGEEPVHERCE